MSPRASSENFLRVNSRYPESFRFLGLCGIGGSIGGGISVCIGGVGITTCRSGLMTEEAAPA